jgi:hypothetical protein
MTNLESAVYNRISSKCHAYVKHYFPTEYKKFVAASQEEYKTRKSRRNTLADIQNILKPAPEENLETSLETWDYGEAGENGSII